MDATGYKVLVHTKAGVRELTLRDGGEIVIGRDPDCNVVLAEGRVSRRHAVVRQRAGALELVDLGSRNGSVLDGQPASPHVVMPIRATSVVRIGSALLVFEETQGPTLEQWCFDAPAFDKRAAALLAAANARRAYIAVIELRWEVSPDRTNTTDAAPPAALQQVLRRIAGPSGLIGAHEPGRIVLLLPDVDPSRVTTSAGVVKRFCEEHAPRTAVRTASSLEARSVAALLAQCAETTRTRLPPVVFHGALRSVDTLLAKLDASEAAVLLYGETGVGKEVLARTLHERSRRADGPLVSLNCAAFTEALFESELLGLEAAAGGTVFLDEIGELPLSLQAKLLRVVEHREVHRVGALQPTRLDVRFVFATNRDLRREVEAKTFRSDLLFRIGSITLTVPPLRERVDEITPLARHFVEVTARRIGGPVPVLLPETQRFLEGHAWPGNVRELKNVLELAVLVQEGGEIRPSDIHLERYISSEPPPPKTDTTEKTEREQIIDALERTLWNQSSAAKLLGISRRTLVKRLGKYDVPRPRKRED